MTFIYKSFFAFLLLLFFIQSTFAASLDYDQFPKTTEGQVTESLEKLVPIRFSVDHPLFFAIRFKEALNRFFKPSASSRASFDLVLSGKRVKEAYLLTKKGDIKNASMSLKLYYERLDKMVAQIEKAKSQNQDVVVLSSQIVDNLKNHETLLVAIYEKSLMPDEYNFAENYKKSINSFENVVLVADEIQSGVLNRFKIINHETEKNTIIPSPTPEIINNLFESTNSPKPRRIIY